jgi:hypothetical protein
MLEKREVFLLGFSSLHVFPISYPGNPKRDIMELLRSPGD